MVRLPLDCLSYLPDPGIFQYSFRMAGSALLFYSSDHFRHERHKGLLQPLLRKRPVILRSGRAVRTFQEKRYSEVDEKQGVSLWISDLLFRHVFPDAVEHVSRIFRISELKAGCQIVMDLQAALALGLSRDAFSRGRRPICLWVLQRHAHLHSTRTDHNGSL